MSEPITEQLRNACNEIRRRPYPIADLIPLMQRAADHIDAIADRAKREPSAEHDIATYGMSVTLNGKRVDPQDMFIEPCKWSGCGSYAFNLHNEQIDQGNFCDRHYWQARAEKAEAKCEPKPYVDWYDSRSCGHCGMVGDQIANDSAVIATYEAKREGK